MRQHNLLATDVDVKELAVETKNYSGAELEGLVRAAQSTAMNRHIKVRVPAHIGAPCASTSTRIKGENVCENTHVTVSQRPTCDQSDPGI